MSPFLGVEIAMSSLCLSQQRLLFRIFIYRLTNSYNIHINAQIFKKIVKIHDIFIINNKRSLIDQTILLDNNASQGNKQNSKDIQ